METTNCQRECTAPSLEDVAMQLLSLSDQPCNLRHEGLVISDEHPICDEASREKTLGCAHTANKIMNDAIDALIQHDCISIDEAYKFQEVLRRLEDPMIVLDLIVQEEYRSGVSQLSTRSQRAHQVIIQKRKCVRDRLLEMTGVSFS